MDIHETSRYLTERGIEVSVPTLRGWRKTWPTGVCRGPRPILVTPRKLRYTQHDCDALIRETFDPAEIAG
jgi:hypothetical protein